MTDAAPTQIIRTDVRQFATGRRVEARTSRRLVLITPRDEIECYVIERGLERWVGHYDRCPQRRRGEWAPLVAAALRRA